MALRRQVPESAATYADPVLGVNLELAEQDLKEGQARLMQNCVYDGGTRIRTGSTRLTTSALAASRQIRGGYMYYFGGSSPSAQRIVAFSTELSRISDAGTETSIDTGKTNDLDTHFFAWSITDELYITNGTDVLQQYDGTSESDVTGTSIPTPRNGPVQPIVDRLMCITTNGIERTDPRSDSIWSANSSWATLRPLHAGQFTGLKSFTMRGQDTIFDGMLAFQSSAYYLITGTDFGSDVTAATASSGENGRIRLLNPSVGTQSPYSITVVPGVGMFWFTNDFNVYFHPEDATQAGRYVGNNIRSNGTTTGIEGVNASSIGQVWSVYKWPFLMFGIPVGSDTYASTQWWLDIRSFIENPRRGPVWYGPMTGQTVGRVWDESQIGDNDIYAGEGNSSTGAFVYRLRVPSTFADNIGATATNIPMVYQTNFKDFGAPSREKYIRGVHFDMNAFSGSATMDLLDLNGAVESAVSVTTI